MQERDDQYVCTEIWLRISTHMITSGLLSTLMKFGKVCELSQQPPPEMSLADVLPSQERPDLHTINICVGGFPKMDVVSPKMRGIIKAPACYRSAKPSERSKKSDISSNTNGWCQHQLQQCYVRQLPLCGNQGAVWLGMFVSHIRI